MLQWECSVRDPPQMPVHSSSRRLPNRLPVADLRRGGKTKLHIGVEVGLTVIFDVIAGTNTAIFGPVRSLLLRRNEITSRLIGSDLQRGQGRRDIGGGYRAAAADAGVDHINVTATPARTALFYREAILTA